MYWNTHAHRDAMMAARGSSMEDNLAYLQANIGYFLELDSGQPGRRLAEIMATMSVIQEQVESGQRGSRF